MIYDQLKNILGNMRFNHLIHIQLPGLERMPQYCAANCQEAL